MHESGIKLLKLMFRPEETICVSPNQYAWHSIALENAISGKITLVPPDSNNTIQYCDSSELTLVALNPIKRFRQDSNCYKFRNFLVELDTFKLAAQIDYIKHIGIPYSALIFSGSKSIHTLISLDIDLPDEKTWRYLSEWTLNIASAADPNTKNPSRSIRIPGAYRELDKLQRLVEFKGPTKFSDFKNWLLSHPESKPKKYIRKLKSENKDISRLPSWVAKALIDGLNPTKGRNTQWFSISCEFFLSGFSEDDTIDMLSEYFVPEHDFKEREWRSTIKRAFKYMVNRV